MTETELELETWEEKMDELNGGLLKAYAAGFSQAVETFDVETDINTDVDALTNNEAIQMQHYYFWDGRSKPLELWLKEEL